jgi:hypothetical protein
MLQSYTVCLTFDPEKCKAVTSELAKRNNAIDYVIESVTTGDWMHFQVAYRGRIIKEAEKS